MKPGLRVEKFVICGTAVARSVFDTPIQLPGVAAS